METKWCSTCDQTLPIEAFVKVLKTGKPYFRCKECHKKRNRETYLVNRERYLAYRKEYHEKNRAKIIAQDHASRLQRKLEVWKYYGNGVAACVCCGASEIEFLTLDHIDANGADHRREMKQQLGGNATGWFIYKWLIDNGFPEGYQTMCFNCNVGKHRSKVNCCPHELQRQRLTELVLDSAQQAA